MAKSNRLDALQALVPELLRTLPFAKAGQVRNVSNCPPHKTVHFESEFSGKTQGGELTMKRKRFTEEQIIGILQDS